MKRWLNWIVLVVLFAIACGFLANWQLSRRETRLAAIELVRKNFDAEAVSPDSLISNNRFESSKYAWRTVKVSGHYLADKSLLVRNRPNNGTGGFEQLVPFETDSGLVFYVSRGWLPTGERQNYPDMVPKPTSATTLLFGRLIAEEPILERGAPRGQLASINIALANQQTGLYGAVAGGYIRLIDESPDTSTNLQPMPNPATEEGNNLSYAVQWIIFALMAFGALIWRVRRDRQLANSLENPRKTTRANKDEEYEDSMTEQ